MIAPDDTIEMRADGETLAQCALWWTRTPLLEGERVGYIGGYARTDARAAQHLLQDAASRLARAGCRIAVGPVDGSTWHRYRFVTQPGTQPPFFLEPQNPPEYPRDLPKRNLRRWLAISRLRKLRWNEAIRALCVRLTA